MRKYLLPVLLFVTAFVVVFTDVSAQTVEVQVLTNDGMFSSTGTGANCRACDNDVPNHQVRLRYVFGSTSGEAGYNASPGCGVYSASGPVGTNPITSVSAQNYGTTATIQLSGEDTRSCGSGDISWDNASTGATFTHTAIAPGGTYSSLYTSTRTAGTSTTGTRWQFRWRYVTAGSAGTLTVPTGNSYCSGSLPGTLTINGTAATGAAVGGVIYEWSYSFDGYSTIIGSGQNLSIPFPSTGYTYRRRTKWRSNYDNVSPAYVTADASTTITVSSPPTGSVVTPINACSGGTVSTTISGYSAGSGSATIEVRDPLNVLVYSGTSPSISFDAPVTLGVPNQTVSYSVTALPSGSACTTPVNLGTLVVNYYEGSKAPDSIQVSPGTTICEGTSLTLTARGARLGYGGARYEWSTSPSFGTIIHTSTTDSTYTTGPVDSSITYYARIGNVTTPGSVCSPFTGNASKLITVIDSTLPPTSVTPGTATYCEGSGVPVVLNQVGGSLGTGAVWQWSTEPTFTTGVIPSASGPTLNVLPGTGSFPAATTTYYVRGINNTAPCSPTSDYASAVVEFSEESEAPTGITLSTNGVCQGTSIDLTLVGGSLGAGAQWYWYANSCGGTPIDSGVSITVTPSTSTSYFVRAEGDCNITDCADDYVLIFEPAEDPDSIAFEPVLCIDSYSEVSLSVVGGVLGTGMDWFWYSDVSLDDIYEVGSGTTINVDPFTYPELWMIAKSDGSLGAIPAPCPATTTPLYADLRTVTFEVYPVMNDLYADEDVFCDSGTPTLYADGVLDGYDYDFNTVVSPFAQYMLYDEDPALNPSAVALDSNTTGIFASVYTDTTTIYYVVVRNSCGISNVMSVPITINYSSVAPTEFTLVSQDSICNGDATNVTLTVNGTLGTDAIYEWSTDEFATVDNLLGNTNTINVSPTSTTTYSVRINNTAAPCTDVSAEVIDYTITVTEPSIAPTALTASADSICNGDLTDVTITADGTLGTDAVYEWSTDGFATVDGGLGNTNTIVVSPTTTTTYSARIVGPAPCSDVSGTVVSRIVTVTEPSDAPTVLTASADSICNGDLTDVTITADGTLGTDAVYEWSTDGFATVDSGLGNTNTIVVSPTATTTYSARIVGPAPCSDVSGTVVSRIVTVTEPSDAPTVLTASADSICNGDLTDVTITADGTLGTDAVYEWSTDGFATVDSGLGNTNTIVVSPTATTTYSARISGPAPCSDVSGTVASRTVTVTEASDAPTALTASADSICNGDLTDVTITADGTLGTDAVYEWSTDGFATVDSGLGNTNTIVVSPTATTTYSARIVGPAPCSDVSGTVVSRIVTVTEPSDAPTVLTASADSICNGDLTDVTITADGTLGTDAVYEWSTDGFATVDGDLGNTNTIVVSPTATTTYSARITGTAAACTDVSGIVASRTVTVTEPSDAPTALTASADSICNGDLTDVTITADGTLGTDAVYEWSTDGFATVDSGLGSSNTIVVSPTATTTYSARIVGPAPCSDVSGTVVSTLVTVTEGSIAPTVLTASADSICNGDLTDVTITADGTLGTDAVYEWSTDGFATVDSGLGNTNTIVVSPTVTTTYSARISGPAPCSDVSGTVVSTLVTVTEGSIAPTVLTASADSICNGDLTDVTITADGTLGTDAVYEWSTDGFATVDSGLGNTNTIVVSPPTATTTYSARISGPAPCSDVSGTVVSTTVTVMEPSDAPTALVVSADTLCNGANVTITADGTLGTDAVYEWSTDGFATVDGGLGSSNTIVVSPTTTTTYSARISGPTPCADISATEVSATVTVIDASTAPASITVSDPEPCYNESIQLTQIGGALNSDVAYFEWATDAAFTNIIDTSSSSTISVIITEPTEYYVRIVNPVCATTSAASVSVDWVQASDVVFGDNLTNTSTIASTCSIDDNDWHYFVDEEGDVVAAINSNGQDLGQVVWTVSVGDNGPFTNPNNTLCTAGEYHVARKYSFMTENQATSPVGIRLFITPGEYASHKAISDAQDAMYAVCWGTTSTAADLQVSAFYAHDNGALGVGISPSASLNVGPGGSHQYQFSVLPNYGGGGRLDPNGRNNPANNTEFYIHNTGGRSSVLPVELTSFTATKVTEGVLLNWNTASELNNDRFEVTRSTDGVNFETIGYVSGMGTTNNPQQYSFLDKDVASGVYYYQLRQVDFDGTAELSKIVSVEITAETVLNVGLFFPNPAQRVSSVVVNSPDNANIVFTLYSIDGKQALNKVYSLARGENRIDVDLNNVPAGSYISIFQTQGQIINRKLIVQE